MQIYLAPPGAIPPAAGSTGRGRRRGRHRRPDQEAFLALSDPNDWTHDGDRKAGRSSTRPSPRRKSAIPTGRGTTADMARPGPRTWWRSAYPPYQFDSDARRAGRALALLRAARLRCRRAEPPGRRQHARDVPRGRCQGRQGPGHRPIHHLPGPEPQHSQGKVLRGVAKRPPVSLVGLNDFQPAGSDDAGLRQRAERPCGGWLLPAAGMFDEARGPAGRSSCPVATTSASRPTRRCCRTCHDRRREHTGLDATSYGNHEFDYGLDRLLAHQERANFPFLATSRSRESSRRTPAWVTPSKVFRSTACGWA